MGDDSARRGEGPEVRSPSQHPTGGRFRGGLAVGIVVVVAILGGLILAQEAAATHVRQASLSWEPMEEGDENEVVFTGSFAARASWEYFTEAEEGAILNTGANIRPGDGHGGPTIYVEVETVDEEADWLYGRLVASDGGDLRHTYPSPNDDGDPFPARAIWCCRLEEESQSDPPVESYHVNNHDQHIAVRTAVDLEASPDGAPQTDLGPIQDCPLDAVCTFEVPHHHDGTEDVTFRLATEEGATTSDSSYLPPGPPHAPNALSIDAGTGTVAWNTTDALHNASAETLDTLYSVQIMLETEATKAPVDFLIRVYPNVPEPPQAIGAEAGPDAGEITVNWDEPADDGGASVTAYTVYAADKSAGDFVEAGTVDGSARSFTEAGLGNDQTRCYKVTAQNRIGEGDASSTACATTYSVPDPPASIETDPGVGEIGVSWTEPPDDGGSSVTSYVIYGADGPDGSFQPLMTTDGQTLTFTEDALDDGQTRCYRITAENLAGESDPSDTGCETTFTPPEAPRDVLAEGGPGAGEITVTWQPPADDGGTPVTEYRIYACDRCFVNPDQIGTVDVGTLSFTESGLDTNQLRRYWVAAVNEVGEGRLVLDTARTFAVPHPPEDVDAQSEPGLGTVEITWTEPRFKGRTDLTGYNVYRSTDEQDGYEHVAAVDADAQSYVDEGGLLTTYHYHVTAENIAGESEASESACTKPFPWEPTGEDELCWIPSPPSP